jgi:adenylylsulfate reductase subunit B
MTVVVNRSKCTGCKGLDFPRCVQCCPGDLMALDKNDKSYIRDEQDCWDCMACVKECPHAAISTKLPYQIALYKATLQPKVFRDKIKWTLTDIDGGKEQFELRTKEF